MDLLTYSASEDVDEVPYERRNIFPACAQRRLNDWEDVQAIVEVAAKLIALHHLL
jgi:hypothetical protein